MGKVEAVRTTAAFAELIEKSGILSGKQLEQAKQACSETSDLRTAARRLIAEKMLTLWQAKQLLAGFHALKFGKFKLLEEIGGGSLGRVYLAEHGQLGRRVALKTLSRRHNSDKGAIDAFLAQARDVAALDHRNLIHVYDVGSEGDRYYVVMEYAQGKDLGQIVGAEGPLAIDRAADIVRQAAEGLAHAHERQVSHCDLKPSNLLIDPQNTVKIMDVGVARLNSDMANPVDDASSSEQGSDIGSFFRSPEQSDGVNGGEALSDIYSLGCIFYYLLTGRPPYAQQEGEKWTREAQLESLTSLRDDLPAELSDLCTQMMASLPSERPQLTMEIAQSIAAWQATQAGAEAPADPESSKPATPSAMPDGFTAKAGAPPVRKALPKAKLLVAKALEPDPEPSVPASDSANEFSVNVKKPAAKNKKVVSSDTKSLADTDSEFSVKADTKSAAIKVKGKKNAEKKKGTKEKVEKSASSLPPQKILILCAASAAVLLLLLVSGTAYWLMSGDKGKNIAKADPQAQEEGLEQSGDGENKMAEEKPEGTEENKSDAPVEGEAKPLDATQVEANKPVVAESAAAPTASDPLLSATPAVPPAETKPEVKEPEATSKAAGVETVALNSKPTPPPKPVVVPDPFVGFPPSVELPPIGSDSDSLKPVEIGPIKIDAKALCIVHLVGNDFAFKGGKQKYAIEAGDNGTSLRDWDIYFRDVAAESGGAKIATFSLRDGKMNFVWLPEAINQKASPYLCNCVMTLASGPKSHTVALRKSVERDALLMDFSKPSIKETLKLPFLPDPSKVAIRISVDGVTAKHRFEPKGIIDADKDYTFLGFGENDAELILKLRIEAETKKDLEITLSPMYQVSGMTRPEKLTSKILKEAGGPAARAMLDGMSQQLAMAKQKAGTKAPPQVKLQLDQAEERLRQAQQGANQGAAIKNLAEGLSGNAKIHVEIFYKAESKELMLATTNPPAAKFGNKK